MYQQRPWSSVRPPALNLFWPYQAGEFLASWHLSHHSSRCISRFYWIYSLTVHSLGVLWAWWYGGCKTGAGAWTLQIVAFLRRQVCFPQIIHIQAFHVQEQKSVPWVNCKGSDCTLIMKFLRVTTAGFLLECQDSEQRRVMSMMLSMARLGVNFSNDEENPWILLGQGLYVASPPPEGIAAGAEVPACLHRKTSHGSLVEADN